MKYLFMVFFSVLLPVSHNANADIGRVINDVNSVIGGIVGNVRNDRPRQHAQPRPSSSRQPVKKKVSRDQSPIAIAYRNLQKEKQFILQTRLKDRGLYTSRIDGVWGRGTSNAIKDYARNSEQQHLLTTFIGAETLVSNILNNTKSGTSTQTEINVGSESSVEISSSITTVYSKDISGLESKFEDIQNQVELLKIIIEDQESRPENSFKQSKIAALKEQIIKYDGEQVNIASIAKTRFNTPIRPQNKKLGITAAKASETFPKIPYYIPGTKEIGDMWIQPKVSDIGELFYSFTFMDPVSDYAKVRESIALETKDLDLMVNGFEKVNDWTKISQDKGLRKRFSKRVVCFPAEDCLEKKIGNTSTEVIFLIYENGSTAAKIQRNKGDFSSDYNFSLESSMMLAAYLEFVKGVGQKEFDTGSMSEKDIGTLFE